MILIKTDIQYRLHNEEGMVIATSTDGKLSIKNCEAVFNGYDLDELAEICADNKFPVGQKNDPITDENYGCKIGFKAGFQKRDELLGDKKFSEQDMYKMFIYGRSIDTAKKHIKELEDKPMNEFFNDFIQSLQQTEIDVEICCYIGNGDKESDSFKDPLVTNTGIPKLDKDGCLILKRK